MVMVGLAELSGLGCLAEKHGVPQEALRKRLDRGRRNHPDQGWIEVADRRAKEPKYLYDPSVTWVRETIEDLEKASSTALNSFTDRRA